MLVLVSSAFFTLVLPKPPPPPVQMCFSPFLPHVFLSPAMQFLVAMTIKGIQSQKPDYSKYCSLKSSLFELVLTGASRVGSSTYHWAATVGCWWKNILKTTIWTKITSALCNFMKSAQTFGKTWAKTWMAPVFLKPKQHFDLSHFGFMAHQHHIRLSRVSRDFSTLTKSTEKTLSFIMKL